MSTSADKPSPRNEGDAERIEEEDSEEDTEKGEDDWDGRAEEVSGLSGLHQLCMTRQVGTRLCVLLPRPHCNVDTHVCLCM